MIKPKLVRITTVPLSLQKLIAGQMRFMGENGFEVTMISSDFPNKEELAAAEQATYVAINMTRTISPFSDLGSLYKLIRTLQKIKPTIVHTHTPKAGLLGMMASWITRVPIRLHTVAGLPLMESHGLKRVVLSFVERITYACSTKVYPNSNELKNFILKEKFAGASKLKVIGDGSSNGIDTTSFIRTLALDEIALALAERHQITTANFTFVFIGRLVKDKGIEELVEAFSALCKSQPDLRLLLVGPEEPELDPLSAACLAEIHTNPAIIPVGYQNDVRPYLSMSRVLVFPSYREGFPNVPLQAGCFDLPSIVTNINGCNEIINDGENGLIIPVKNSEALRFAMESLYLDRNLYQSMALKARGMVVDRYEQRKVWSLILTEYKLHLKQKRIVYQGN